MIVGTSCKPCLYTLVSIDMKHVGVIILKTLIIKESLYLVVLIFLVLQLSVPESSLFCTSW